MNIYIMVFGFIIWGNDHFSELVEAVPVLNITEKYIDVPLDSTYVLKCTGDGPLEWKFDRTTGNGNMILQTLSAAELSEKGDLFESILKLEFKTYEDTGRYNCISSNDTEWRSASVYIFVNDMANLLLPTEDGFFFDIIHVIEAQRTTVPCLPTNSGTNVTFWKGDCLDEPVPSDRLSFDPTQGFIIPHPNKDFQGRFCCWAQLDIQTKSFSVIFEFTAETQIIPQVEIDKGGNFSIIVGSNFILTCIIRTHDGTMIDSKWSYPVSDLKRISTEGHTKDSSRDSPSFVAYIDELVVNDVQKEDEGIYQCNVTDHSKKTNYAQVYVTVLELKKPYFTKTNMNTSEVVAYPYQEFPLFCYVDGVPKPTVTWYRNSVLLDSSVSEIKFDDDFQKLVIYRVLQNDSGSYICMAQNKDGISSLNTTLVVREEGKLQAVISQKMDSKQIAVFSVVGVGVLSTLILVFLLGRRLHRHKKRRTQLQMFYHKVFREGQISLFNPDLPLDDQAELLPYDERWELPGESLKLGRTLGQGAFGRVVKAEAVGLNDCETSTTVAVKMLKERADVNQQKALMAELKILIHLGHHVNIVNLLGAVTKNIPKGELMVVVEYCRYGNLRHYLLKYRDKFLAEDNICSEKVEYAKQHLLNDPAADGSNGWRQFSPSPMSPSSVENRSYELFRRSVTSSPNTADTSGSDPGRTYCRVDSKEHTITCGDLICFSFQCARGMDYLASKKLIHRDLAARNILLAEENIVKICDFGLAKDCYKYSNYVKKGDGPLPVKWMAIESIGDKVFTTKSDVWSFGVLLWEFFTLGGNPYPGVEVNEDFYKKLKHGYRMGKPELAPEIIYQIMRDCWRSDPVDRPEFTQLANALGELLDLGIKQHYIDLNEPYMEMNQNTSDHSYLNTKRQEQEPNVTYVNALVSDKFEGYDNVPPVRYNCDGETPKSPMEVVPMIYFESEEKIPESPDAETTGRSDSQPCPTDYLNMNDEFSSDKNDSVFLDSPPIL